MDIEYVPGHTNMVPDALLQYADVVTSVTVDNKLLPLICSSQEVAMGEL